MSYKKAMQHATHPNLRKGRNQYMGFTTLDENERRKLPWLGSSWFEPGREEDRQKFYKEWEIETERLLKENPDLKIVG